MSQHLSRTGLRVLLTDNDHQFLPRHVLRTAGLRLKDMFIDRTGKGYRPGAVMMK